MRTFNHIGIVHTQPLEGEFYNEGMKVYLTDFSKSKNHIEWLRFDSDSWMPKLIQTETHIAYNVTDLKEELKDAKVLLEPVDCGDDNWIAFIEEEGIAVELMYHGKLN